MVFFEFLNSFFGKIYQKVGIFMEFKANDYNANEVLKFIRQSTGKTQEVFSHEIKKSKNWVKNNEQGLNRYFFEDLVKIAKLYKIDIIIKKRD